VVSGRFRTNGLITRARELPMRRISSRLTWWYKKAFPTFWFGFIGVVTVSFIPSIIDGRVTAETLLIPLVMVAFGYLLMRWLVFPLMDEVWIENGDLVVGNRGEVDRFPISNVVDVEGSYMTYPEHIGLTLAAPSRFGKVIRFSPPFRWLGFGTHPLAQELIDRSHCFDR
jgi:hypothetical protein